MKKIMAILLVFACFTALFSCEAVYKDPEGTLTSLELLAEIYKDATPGEPSTDITPPGDPTPVEQLDKASDALLGKQLTVRLKNSNETTGVVVFFDPATEGKSERTTILMESDDLAKTALVQIETSYGGKEGFRKDFNGLITGKVTAVHIICSWDYRYPYNKLYSAQDKDVAENQSGSLYCHYLEGEQTKIFDETDFDDLAQFERVRTRFGI